MIFLIEAKSENKKVLTEYYQQSDIIPFEIIRLPKNYFKDELTTWLTFGHDFPFITFYTGKNNNVFLEVEGVKNAEIVMDKNNSLFKETKIEILVLCKFLQRFNIIFIKLYRPKRSR